MNFIKIGPVFSLKPVCITSLALKYRGCHQNCYTQQKMSNLHVLLPKSRPFAGGFNFIQTDIHSRLAYRQIRLLHMTFIY